MQEPSDNHQLRRVLFSLVISILVTFVAAIALDDFTYSLGFTGTINGSIILIWTLFAAFLYSLFSVSMLQYSARKSIAKVARIF